MLSQPQESEVVTKLAKQVVEDIRSRGLAPGDRYLTSEQVRRTFGVGKGVMNRTLQLLGKQNVLVRRQKVGTLIGPNAPVRPRVKVQTIHALLPADRKDVFGFPFDLMIRALCTEISGTNLQFSFVPNQDSVPYVRELLSSSQALGHCYGIVSISGRHELNAYLAKSGIPSIAFSSYAREEDALPSVDLDLREGGRLLVEYLLEHGHRRIAFLNAAEGRPGDNQLFDGISAVLTEARLPHDALIYRSLEPRADAIHAETCRLLRMSNRPTAFIGRVGSVAEVIARAASSEEMVVPRDMEIVFIDHATEKSTGSPFPHVQPAPSFEETARMIGAMLKKLAHGEPLEPKRVLVPVRFCLPRNRAAAGSRKMGI